MPTATQMVKVARPKKTDSRALTVGQRVRVFSDIQIPFEILSTPGTRYALSFIDDFSRLAVAKYRVNKSDALVKFHEYVAEHGAPMCLRMEVRICQML